MAKEKTQHPAVAAVMAPLEQDRVALAKQGAEIDALLAEFKLIETPAQYEAACDLRARASAFVKSVETKFTGTEKAPGPKALMYAAYKALGDLEKDLSAPGRRVVDGLKRPILDYQDRQERARRDEEERLRREAAARAEAEAEIAAMMAAEDSPVPIAAEAVASAKAVAAATASAAVTLPRTSFVPEVEGQVRSENWVAEITNVDALLRALLDDATGVIFPLVPGRAGWRERVIEALQPLANMKAKEVKAAGAVPGIRFFDDPRLSQRGARG